LSLGLRKKSLLVLGLRKRSRKKIKNGDSDGTWCDFWGGWRVTTIFKEGSDG